VRPVRPSKVITTHPSFIGTYRRHAAPTTSRYFKMKLLWLIGIEGSGHHMIRDVLRDFLASREVIDKGDYYPLWLQRWDGEQDPLPRQARAECLGGDSE